MNVVLKVEGMMCTHCKSKVEKVCKNISGITDAVVDLQNKQVTVSGEVDVIKVKQAIVQAGFQVVG